MVSIEMVSIRMEAKGADELEDVEVQPLLEAVYNLYGFDFRGYDYGHLKRRILHAVRSEKLGAVSALQDRVLRDPAAMERLLLAMAVRVTSMFRDPGFYLAFQKTVVPILKTYPFIRIWDAGCATGEEAYSMAILLEEEDLYERCRIYATDLSESVVAHARDGVYSLSSMQEYSANYIRAGGQSSLSDYFTARYGSAIFRTPLKRNLVFARHNLVTDSSFNVFHVILCRNVMIYFGEALRNHVHELLCESLVPLGILGLGNSETTRFTSVEPCYAELDYHGRLFRKVSGVRR